MLAGFMQICRRDTLDGAGKPTLYDSLVAPRYPALEFFDADMNDGDHLVLAA